MRISFACILLGCLTLISGRAQAQQPFEQVYALFTANCAASSCHSAADKAGGLDLDGGGNTDLVYDGLLGKTPTNTTSAAMGHQLVFPGDPYRSLVFRKVNNGLDKPSKLTAGEGTDCPKNGNFGDKDKELIRQWILWGAKKTGNAIDTAQIRKYYDEGGINSMPNLPAAPAEETGIQLHMGPFFLDPHVEDEFCLKYKLNNPAVLEMTKGECVFGQGYSHHFIAYQFDDDAAGFEEGLRRDFSFSDKTYVGAYQHSDSTVLPPNTAYPIRANSVLDLNSHYINASNKVLACHVYYNIWTQPEGTAIHTIQSTLIPNTSFSIPPNDQPKTFNYKLQQPYTIYVYMLSSHTHKLGKSFKYFYGGQEIFDASKVGGNPDSMYIGYDYSHPPQRYFYPTLPVDLSLGMTMQAVYQNPGPNYVGWGFKSTDEMMLGMIQYSFEPIGETSGIDETQTNETAKVRLFPNPVIENATIKVAFNDERFLGRPIQMELYDALGRLVETQTLGGASEKTSYLNFQRNGLTKGLYHYQLSVDGQRLANGKLSIGN